MATRSSISSVSEVIDDDDLQYVYPLPKGLDTNCPVCFSALYTDPYVNVTCGHHICGACSARIHECPNCRSELDLSPDLGLQRMLKSLVVYCNKKEQGCQWEGELGELERHHEDEEKGCLYVKTKCPHNGCEVEGLRHEILTHKEMECPFRPMICEHCKTKFSWKFIMTGHYERCSLYPLTCTACGMATVRKDMEKHVEKNCPKTIVSCNISSYGCEWEGPREEMEQHMKEEWSHHFYLGVQSSFESAKSMFKEELEDYEDRFNRMEAENEACFKKTEATYNDRFEKMETTYNDHFKKMEATYNDRFKKMETTYNDRFKKMETTYNDRFKKMETTYNDRFKKMETTYNDRFKKMEATYNDRFKKMEATYNDRFKKTEATIDEKNEEIQALQRKITKLSDANQRQMSALKFEIIQMEEKISDKMEQNFIQWREEIEQEDSEESSSDYEEESSDGDYYSSATVKQKATFIYSLKKFRRSKDEGKVCFSQPFYTSNPGYRMRLRVHPNGYGRGEGTHISVYVCLLEGNSDELLDWPFYGTIVLQLQNGSKQFKRVISYDHSTPSDFATITKRSSKGNGYPCFLQHTEVEQYLINNTLDIYVTVNITT